MRTLVAYDIADTRLRNRVFKQLQTMGDRVQKSVFLLDASQTVIKKLVAQLRTELAEDDSILVLPCCDDCLARALVVTAMPHAGHVI